MELITTIFVAFVTSVIGTFFAPWVNWGVEKRRSRFQARRKLVDDARRSIEKMNSKSEFLSHEIYSRLHPHLSKKTFEYIGSSSTNLNLVGDVVMVENIKGYILSDIMALEKKWKLI